LPTIVGIPSNKVFRVTAFRDLFTVKKTINASENTLRALAAPDTFLSAAMRTISDPLEFAGRIPAVGKSFICRNHSAVMASTRKGLISKGLVQQINPSDCFYFFILLRIGLVWMDKSFWRMMPMESDIEAVADVRPLTFSTTGQPMENVTPMKHPVLVKVILFSVCDPATD
jgi:hypothetical protein